MSISLKELGKKENRNKRKELIQFLQDHKDEAFTGKELSKTLNIPYSYLAPLLNQLAKTELITHQKPYWHITEAKT